MVKAVKRFFSKNHANSLWISNAWFLVALAIFQGTWLIYAGERPGTDDVPLLIDRIGWWPRDFGIKTHGIVLVLLGVLLVWELRGRYDKGLRLVIIAYTVYSILTSVEYIGTWWITGSLKWSLSTWWLAAAFLAGVMVVHHPIWMQPLRPAKIEDE